MAGVRVPFLGKQSSAWMRAAAGMSLGSTPAMFSTKPKPHATSVMKNVSVDDMHKSILPTSSILFPAENPDWQVVTPRHFDDYIAMPPHWQVTLAALQDDWDWHFTDVTHLQCALTHFSVISSHTIPLFPANRAANRSLEWLGDSVLQACASSYLFQSYPTTQEGQLSQLRSALVKNPVLDVVAVQLKLPSAIIVGHSISQYDHETTPQALKQRQTVHASAVEALIGAVLLDQGMTRAIEFVNTRVLPLAIEFAVSASYWDPISDLQREAVAKNCTIRYDETKLDDDVHRVVIHINEQPVATADAGSFKSARIEASRQVLDRLQGNPSYLSEL
ncbi:ribonuclease 3 [Achlya hypogyna]|uniref:Ribonuclease 3 n=1 Tax=Achlya hypogyna TaxID=1202772 RepID=A0A1V9YQH0_ACHHY|nr:ribonuclease 3 [Achlya hypogyna]